jgi:predicted nucleic acid-binding protein
MTEIVPPAERIVLDCSIVMAWFFEDESDAYAEAIEAELTSLRFWVPGHWSLEIVNTMLVGLRRGRTTEVKVADFRTDISTYSTAVDPETSTAAWHETLRLARLYGLSSYDAAYLEPALRRKLPLATIDQPLAKAATLAGVPLFQPPKPTP